MVTAQSLRTLVLALVGLGASGAKADDNGSGLRPELQLDTSVSLDVDTLPSDGRHDQRQDVFGPSGVLRSNSHSLRLPAGSANAYATAGYGMPGAAVDTAVSNLPLPPIAGPAYGYSSGSGHAEFIDVLRVDGDARNGQAGSLIVPWAFSGGGASASLAGPLPRTDQSAFVQWRLTLSSATLDRNVLGSTQADGVFYADTGGDLDHTLRWGGISSVLDGSGNAMSNHSVVADSGTDYSVANTSAVPEPPQAALLLAGLLLLAGACEAQRGGRAS